MASKHEITIAIKDLAKELGFTACGITPAEALPEDAIHLKSWLEEPIVFCICYSTWKYICIFYIMRTKRLYKLY